MKFLKQLITIVTVFALTGCESDLPRRYKSMAIERQVPRKPLVRTSAFVIEKPKSIEELGVLQLSAEGQAALITSIAKMDSSATGLYQQLAKGFTKQPSINMIDRSQITKRIIFSTQKTNLAGDPADRISRLEFNLNLKDLPESLQFHQWDRFETEYGQVDLGKIGLKKGVELSAKLSPTFGGTLNAGEAGVTVSRELSEEVALRQRFIALTGTLDTHNATLVQEGIVGIDLSGNTSIDLTIKFLPEALEIQQIVKFDSFQTNKGLKNQEEITYRVIPIYLPTHNVVKKLERGIHCDLTVNYVLRHVRKGSETIMEGDDVVVFAQGGHEIPPQEVTLLSYAHLQRLRSRFFIRSIDDEGKNLAIDLPRNSSQSLDFATYEEAEEFLNWISSQKAIAVGGKKLKLNQEPLKQSDIENLMIDDWSKVEEITSLNGKTIH